MKRAFLFAVLVLASAGCRTAPVHARIDAAIAPLVPGDSTVLAGLRIDRLRGTPFFQTFVANGKLPALAAFRSLTGLDPAVDIYEVLYAMRPGHDLIFVRGKFGGQFGFEPRFNAPGVQSGSYKGYYLFTEGSRGVIFFNSGAAAVGGVEDLKRIIDDRDRPGAHPPMSLIAMVDGVPASAQLWMVTESGLSASQNGALFTGNAAGLSRYALGMRQATAYADVSTQFDLHARVTFQNDSTARECRDTVQALAGVARARIAQSEPQLLSLLDSLKVEAKRSEFRFSLQAPFQMIEPLIAANPATTSSQPESRLPGSSNPRPR